MNILVSASYSPAHAVRRVQFRPFLIWMVLVCEGAAFIYVLAGGYSLGTPRKSYIIMPILIMSAAAAIWLIWGPQRTGTCWSSASSAVATISVICMFGCVTRLLVMSVYRMELKRDYLLADFIVQNMISDSFHADWNPELKAIWPASNYDPQDALDRALDARGYKRILLTTNATKCAKWSTEEQRWDCCTVQETIGAAP
jgi:hypothetical protein